MNERWLFVATLVVLGVFAVVVMRYFVAQHAASCAEAQGGAPGLLGNR